MSPKSEVDAFLDVVVKSGVLDNDALDSYVQGMRTAGTLPNAPADLAAALVRDGLLTRFQVNQFLHGKWRGFLISGKYKLLDQLGAGGMGAVFLCEHKSMRRRVAIKVLPAAAAKNPSALERFYREARAVAALDHPNIVRAHDIDHDGKYHFLVLEYVEGASLEQLVQGRGPMDVTRAAHYVRQAALGLHHAHLAGLVHRDVKPSNLLVDRQGVVKILDMGLARFFLDQDDKLTQKHDEGSILGTADYLAPEQAIDSHSVDIRADVYSLGATFYFLLAGRSPFGEGTVAQKLLWHQMRNPQPIREVRPATPEGLATLIARMMEKDRKARYQTPAEVYEALAPWTQTPIPPPSEEEMPQSGARPRSGAAGDGSGSKIPMPSLTSAPWLSTAPAPVFPSAEATQVQMPAVAAPPTAPPVKVEKPPLSRRGPFLWVAAAALVFLTGGGLLGWVVLSFLTAPGSRPTPIASPPPAPPDAPHLGSGPVADSRPPAGLPPNDDKIHRVHMPQYEAVVDADGFLTSLRVHETEFLAPAETRPHGSRLAREGGKGVLKLPAVAQPAANVLTARGDGASLRYEFGPDSVACTATNAGDEPLSFFLVLNKAATAVGDGRGELRKTPAAQEEWNTTVWYGGAGRLKITGGTRIWGSADEPYSTWYAGLAPGETRRVLLEAGGVSGEEAARVAALNNPPAATPPAPPPAYRSHVCIMSVDDLIEQEIFSSPDRWDCAAWAPDGKTLLCNSKGKLHRLWPAGGAPEDFPTGTLAPGRDFAFSPDGKRLAFTSGDGIFLVPASGGEPAPILPKKPGYIHGWSPDGRTVVYTATRGAGPFGIYSRLADGGEETRLTAYAGVNDGPDFSPDGKWIYFQCDKGGKVHVWRVPASGGGPNDERAEQVTHDAYQDWFPHPSPDGKWLLFVSSKANPKGAPEKVDVVLRLAPLPGDKPEAGPIREVAQFIGGQGTINAPCWAPDGKRFAYVRYTLVPK